jgi:hypothetical protein
MRTRVLRIFALILVCAAALWAQRRFSWQDYCFTNPSSIVCPGHEYANKPTPPPRPDSPSKAVITHPFSPTPRAAKPSMVVLGGIDWRFADPFADALVGMNFSRISDSSLARNLIAQIGASQNLTDADTKKIFDALSGVDQVAVSVRNNRMVVMMTGRVTESNLSGTEAGLKVVQLPGSATLVGHAEAVDQAAQRIARKFPLGELARGAEERQAASEFWTLASPGLLGPQAYSIGLKRFSLTVLISDRFVSDIAFEFNGVPSVSAITAVQKNLGGGTLEGNAVHLRTSIEADEAQQKFAEIASGPLGDRLGALIQAARYLPVPDTSAAPKQSRPVIYGLDDSPRVVGQDHPNQ